MKKITNYPKNRKSPPCSEKKRQKIIDSINKYNKEHPERYIGEPINKMRNSLKEGYANGKIKVNKGAFKKGNKLSEETKRKISEASSGENHPNWQGGISNVGYPEGWSNMLKESIRKRDDYMCQDCQVAQEELSKRLDVHHIDCNKDNLNPENLISLCNVCHTTRHWELRRIKKC